MSPSTRSSLDRASLLGRVADGSQDPADPGRPRPTRSTAGRTSSGSCSSARPWPRRCCWTTRSSARSRSCARRSIRSTIASSRCVGAFAAQAAVVVRNVHLVRELEERGQELGRKVEQLEALSEVGGLVSSSLVLDEVLSNIIMNAVRFSGCDGGSIMEYVEDERCFSVRSRLCEQSRAAREAAHDPRRTRDHARRPVGARGSPDRGAGPRRGRARSAPAAALRRRLAVDDRGAGAARRADHRGAGGAAEDDG